MKHRLINEQQLHCDLQTAWSFFSDPHNLAAITPKSMGFIVQSAVSDKEIYQGMTIDYTVSPLLGIPLRWKTRITQVSYQHSFTDYQEKGPYALWSHYHEFTPNEKGVWMRDTVDYKLPLGRLGNLFHPFLVRPKLEQIFEYRRQTLEELFNTPDP
jgi:ligand-binding SRPBCC domain-containing protein